MVKGNCQCFTCIRDREAMRTNTRGTAPKSRAVKHPQHWYLLEENDFRGKKSNLGVVKTRFWSSEMPTERGKYRVVATRFQISMPKSCSVDVDPVQKTAPKKKKAEVVTSDSVSIFDIVMDISNLKKDIAFLSKKIKLLEKQMDGKEPKQIRFGAPKSEEHRFPK